VREIKASHGQAPSKPSPTRQTPISATCSSTRPQALCDLRHGPRPVAPQVASVWLLGSDEIAEPANARTSSELTRRNSTGCTRAATSCCSTTLTSGTRRASVAEVGRAVSSSNATRRTASSVVPSLSSFTSRRIQHVCPRSNPHRHRCDLCRRLGRRYAASSSRRRTDRLRQGRSPYVKKSATANYYQQVQQIQTRLGQEKVRRRRGDEEQPRRGEGQVPGRRRPSASVASRQLRQRPAR
jgi:hypothetical protein